MTPEPNLIRLQSLHPTVARKAATLLANFNRELKHRSLRLIISSGYRSIDEQDALFAIGRAKPGNKKTNARGGKSWHNFGLAFDVLIIHEPGAEGTGSPYLHDTDPKLNRTLLHDLDLRAKALGLECGSKFKSFPDAGHYQDRLGIPTLHVARMRLLRLNGEYKKL